MTSKQQPLTGTDRVYLQGLIKSIEAQSEAQRQAGKIVTAAELAQAVNYLRRLLPVDAP
jgi:hypothetical protein